MVRSSYLLKFNHQPNSLSITTKILKIKNILIQLIGFVCFSVLLIFTVAGLFLWLIPQPSEHYLATLVEKQNLLQSVSPPRLILMGGSNLAFGTDSELLEKELKIAVVNGSLDEHLGSYFMMKQLEAGIKKGDLILISLEYDLRSEGDLSTQLTVLDSYPSAVTWVKPRHWLTHYLSQVGHYSVSTFDTLYTRCIPPKANSLTAVYQRKAFSEKGDMKGHLFKKVINRPVFEIQIDTLSDYSQQIQDMNRFIDLATRKEAIVYFTFPSFPQSCFEKNQQGIHAIEKQLRASLNARILGRPEDALMDDELFFDSPYHPNTRGRQIRSYRLIQLLESTRTFQEIDYTTAFEIPINP